MFFLRHLTQPVVLPLDLWGFTYLVGKKYRLLLVSSSFAHLFGWVSQSWLHLSRKPGNGPQGPDGIPNLGHQISNRMIICFNKRYMHMICICISSYILASCIMTFHHSYVTVHHVSSQFIIVHHHFQSSLFKFLKGHLPPTPLFTVPKQNDPTSFVWQETVWGPRPDFSKPEAWGETMVKPSHEKNQTVL